MTYENYEANKHHLTKENAEKAYDGAVWADKKADELGIDKKAVGMAVGSALWSSVKFTSAQAQKVDWNEAAKSANQANGQYRQ